MSKKRFTRNLQVIPATIYPCNIYVFKGFTYEQALSDIRNICPAYHEVYLPKSVFETAGHTIIIPDGSVIITLREDTVNDIPTIVHESFHATEFIMEHVGTPHSEDTSEPFAYLLAYIVEQIIK